MTEKFQKLVDFQIELLPLPEITTHFVFQRGEFAALVERRQDRFGRVGTAGLLTEKGIAPLQWRTGEPYFVAKHFEQLASLEQVDCLRAFQRDLEQALS